jgi:hypothetical protein
MLPRNAIEQMVSAVDRHLLITTAAGDADTDYLEPYQQIVEVDSTLGTTTVYLPDVGVCEGLEFSITALVGATKTVTVTEKSSGNSLDWPGNASLNADLDRVLYKSDGKRWWVITDQFT